MKRCLGGCGVDLGVAALSAGFEATNGVEEKIVAFVAVDIKEGMHERVLDTQHYTKRQKQH